MTGRTVALFLRDHLWMIAATVVSALVPIACLLILSGSEPIADWPYYLFLCCFLLFVFLVIRLCTTWGFYSEAAKALYGEEGSAGLDWRRVRGFSSEARWARAFAGAAEAARQREMDSLLEARTERDALVLSWVHHAKTPTTIIRLIADAGSGDQNMRRIASAAGELERSLGSLIQAVSVDSPENDLRIGKVDLARLAKKSVNGLRDLFIEREVFPSVEGAPGTVAYGDEKLISIVLNQLLTNAVKYSPPSSKVRVSVKETDDGKRIAVTIEDEGCGISQEDIGRVFRPFFTGANGRRGEASTGIGLFLAKRAADATGAELSLRRRDGGGTEARLSLPASMPR